MARALDRYELSPDDMRRRFSAAERAGLPSWLWPDTPVEDWRAALISIEEVSRAVLMDAPCALPFHDTDTLSVACYTSGMGPLLGYWIEHGALTASQAHADLLALHLSHNRKRVRRMTAAAVEVVEALAREGIEVTILKGMHTAHAYFPEPGTRPSSDIDLVVSPAAQPAAERILAVMGFEPGRRVAYEATWQKTGTPKLPRTLMYIHEDDPWSIDLHNSLDRPVGGAMTRLDAMVRAAGRRRWSPSAGGRILPQPELLLYLAVHAGSHFNSLSLIRQLELALIMGRDYRSDELDWPAFADCADHFGLAGLAYPALRLTNIVAPSSVPEYVLERCRKQAPGIVQNFLNTFTPASVHRVDRISLKENYMWADTYRRKISQFLFDLLGGGVSLIDVLKIYRLRLLKIARGHVRS